MMMKIIGRIDCMRDMSYVLCEISSRLLHVI